MTWTVTPLFDLPSLPVLTSIRVRLHEREPSRRIVNVLFPISSTPALAFVDIQYERTYADELTRPDAWNDLDRWLARVAKHTAVERALVLNMRKWALTELSWEARLPRFREAGGEIKVHADGWVNYD